MAQGRPPVPRSGRGALGLAPRPAPRPAGSGRTRRAGAAVHYWLKEEPKGEVTIEILDAAGAPGAQDEQQPSRSPRAAASTMEDEKELQKTRPLAKRKGLQRAVWDLTWEGAEMIRGGDAGFRLSD